MGYCGHLRTIVVVGLEFSDLGRELRTTPESTSGVDEGCTDRFGAAESGSFEHSESPFSLIVEPDGDRLSHVHRVSQIEIHRFRE